MLPFEKIHNSRDFGGFGLESSFWRDGNDSIKKVRTGVLFRCAKPDDASTQDKKRILDEFQVKTMIELRDPKIDLVGGEGLWMKSLFDTSIIETSGKVKNESSNNGRMRYFVDLDLRRSIMRHVFWNHFSIWMKVKTLVTFILFGFDKKAVEVQFKEVFAREDHSLVYISVLENCKRQLCAFLKIASDPSNLPLMINCTLGKDRTGTLVALLLSSLGVSDYDIMSDYVKSGMESNLPMEIRMSYSTKMAEKIRDMGGTSGRNIPVDSDHFAHARPHSMINLLNHIKTRYGSVESYLKKIGFDDSWQEKLRQSLCE